MNKCGKKSVRLTIGGSVRVIKPPTMAELDIYTNLGEDAFLRHILPGAEVSETDKLMVLTAIMEITEDAKKIVIPDYPSDMEAIPWVLYTGSESIAAEYAHISIFEVMELDIYDFRILLRDAVIRMKMQTEDGRKWLKDAYRITQTAPDMDKLRKKFDIKQVVKNNDNGSRGKK